MNIQTKLCFITTISGWTLHGLTTRLVRKLDVPHKGKILHKSTKWTDPIRVNFLHKSTTWMDLIRVNFYISPQSGRTLRGIKICIHKVDGPLEGSRFMSTKWTDPIRVKNLHISPQSGRTPLGIKICIHKVDGPLEGSRFMSTKWTGPTRVKNLHKFTKWTDPTRDQNSYPQSGRTPRGIKIHVHKVDGPNKG